MKNGISIADISGSPGFIKANPHVFAPVTKHEDGVIAPPPKTTVKVKTPREMTKTEREFEAILRREFPISQIHWEWYRIRIGENCWYTPDFTLVRQVAVIGGCRVYALDFFEVKGAYLFKGAHKSATTASLTKPKAAATLYPQHRFFVAQKAKDGTWTREEYRPA